jgi:hypothetical protein
MEITGFDYIVITPETPVNVFMEIFQAIKSKWPLHYVEMDGSKIVWGAKTTPQQLLDKSEGVVHFSRDKDMDACFNDNGYYLGSDGEGPFSLFFSRLGFVTIEADVKTLAYESEIDLKKDDFMAVICGKEFYMMTLVTPEDPIQDKFSNWLVDLMIKACTGK